HDRDRPLPPQQQNRPREQPEDHPQRNRQPRVPRERDPLDRTLDRGCRSEAHIEHRTAPPRPPPGPTPGPGEVFPRRGHASSLRAPPAPFPTSFQDRPDPTPRNRTEAKRTAIAPPAQPPH